MNAISKLELKFLLMSAVFGGLVALTFMHALDGRWFYFIDLLLCVVIGQMLAEDWRELRALYTYVADELEKKMSENGLGRTPEARKFSLPPEPPRA